MSVVRHIPNALTTSRFFIAAFLIADAVDGAASRLFVPLFIVAGVTDVLDGAVARAFKATSLRGTILDSYADIALFGGGFICTVFLFPAALKARALWIIALFAFQFASWGFSLVKFKRMTSYHTFSSKAWALVIFAALFVLFAFNDPVLLIPTCVIGILATTEEILITRTMPCWKGGITGLRDAHDPPSRVDAHDPPSRVDAHNPPSRL